MDTELGLMEVGLEELEEILQRTRHVQLCRREHEERVLQEQIKERERMMILIKKRGDNRSGLILHNNHHQ
ncbi:MAG: hypothetical protein SVM80_06490 [Halobacteriota archaeon]|nr:hypothetical protein [Halobacteriota archaeon]